MGELGIILAILLASWIYATLHPSNEKSRNATMTWVIANVLFFGAIAAGVLEAVL